MAKRIKKIRSKRNLSFFSWHLSLLDHLALLVAFLFIYSSSVVTFCNNYKNTLFDAQALLTWDYVISKGLLPYKDFFYPYGLLQLFRVQSLWGHVFYYFVGFCVLYGYLFILKRIYRDPKIYITLFIVFCIFVQQFAGSETFSRYGVSLLISSLSGYFMFRDNTTSVQSVFTIGILNGLTFALISDQGIITFSVLAIIIIIKGYQLFRANTISLRDIVNSCAFLSIGLLIGFAPLLFFLGLHRLFIEYFNHIIRLGDITEYAKVPFYAGVRTIENLFSIVVILAAVWYLLNKLFIQKENITIRYSVVLTALLCLLIIEQKNILRSIDSVLPFISYFILIIPYTSKIKKHDVLQKIGVPVLLLLPFIIGLNRPQSLIATRSIVDISGIQLDIKSKLNNSCYLENVENILSRNSIYKRLVTQLQKYRDRGTVYSFPSDSVVYVLLDQKPPYYSNAYDSSSKYAQKKQIEFMSQSNYVVYNQAKPFTQDTVPHYIRNPDEIKVLLTQYKIDVQVGSFLIFKRQKSSTDVLREQQKSFADFVTYFLNVDFESVPYSEGFHKSKYLAYNNSISFNSVDEANEYFKKNIIKTDHKLLIVHTNDESMTELTINTKDNMSTSILFKSCPENIPCIISLDRVPLFYNPREINQINSNQKLRFDIITQPKNSIFW